MPSDKRQRKRLNAEERRVALEAQRRRARTRRRAISIGVLVAILAGLILLVSSGGDDDADDVATGTTATTAAGTATTAAAGDGGEFAYGTGECPAADGTAERKLTFDAAPKRCIDPAKSYVAIFDTTEGRVEVALDTKATPGTVNNFVVLSRYGYYDGTRIFRTDPSIDIMQGGSPHTNSASDPGPGYNIPDEGSTDRRYVEGDLVMARSAGPDSAGAQFFFVAGPNASALDSQGTYVTFGRTTAGLDVLKKILSLHRPDPSSQLGGAPSRPVTINEIIIEER